MKKIRFFLARNQNVAIAIGLSLFVMLAGWEASRTPPAEEVPAMLPASVFTIDKQAGGHETFTLEITRTPVDSEIGLMYRKSMDKDHGMIFPFGPPAQPVSFWMKNTYLPLDMLFVDEAGKIAHIHANAKPLSLDSIPSPMPVIAVIEINGGEALKRGIREGDRVGLDPLGK